MVVEKRHLLSIHKSMMAANSRELHSTIWVFSHITSFVIDYALYQGGECRIHPNEGVVVGKLKSHVSIVHQHAFKEG